MRLLIIGTLDGQIGAASQIVMARGAKITMAEDIAHGLDILRERGSDLVMIDVRRDIKALVDALASERIHIPVVACGVASDAAAAVRAIKAGAKEYIPLPPDAELIAAVLEAVTAESRALVFKDPRMAQTLRMAEQVAGSDASVLIAGESGTGKELMARFVHQKSKRADGRFIAINCAAIPEALLESELFGHEKGAFTGAVARRLGKFEEANGGTLLLDEISEMDIRLQAKLLRVLQERVVDRVGGNKPVKVDVRILATSNRNLEDEVRQGRFREDLFYRLNVVTLALPALRERPLDIPLLADHFIRKYSEANGVPPKALTADARTMLLRHGWRGNVRELENTMHRAVLLASGAEIGTEAILLTGGSVGSNPDPLVAQAANAAAAALTAAQMNAEAGSGEPGRGDLVGKTVAEVERDLILDTLHHYLGNRTHAATILGISIRTLRNKLKQYADEGMPIPPPAGGECERATP